MAYPSAPSPSAVINQELAFSPQMFRLDFSNVNTPPNVITIEIANAYEFLKRHVPDPGDDSTQQEKFTTGVLFYTSALLYLQLARQVTTALGLTSGRAGQVNIPLGSADELLKAANAKMGYLKDLYPEVDFPALDRGKFGVIKMVRGS